MKLRNKGLRQILNSTNNSLNLKDLEDYLMSVFKNLPKDNHVRIVQWCNTQGFVERSIGFDLKLCNDPKCASCSMIHKAISKHIKHNLK